jgi:Putative serine esterase (DUF676)
VSRFLRLACTGLVIAGSAAGVGARTSAAAADIDCPGQSPRNTPIEQQAFIPVNGVIPRPIVLVHGWDSSSSAMSGYASLLNSSKVLHAPLRAFLFDYGASSGRWAAVPVIASCLADYINNVSKQYSDAGGDGKVLAVSHSMGGLALRFSASGKYAAHSDGAHLGGVITIDTPHTGSPWGNTPAAQLIQTFTQFHIGNGTEGMLPWPPGEDGEACLAIQHGGRGLPLGCATPPWFPASVPVSQIAGDITVHRQVFGSEVETSDVDGDAIVATQSSLGYLPDSGPGTAPARNPLAVKLIDQCDVTTGQVEAGVGGIALSVLQSIESAFLTVATLGDTPLDSGTQTAFAATDLAAPCSHTNINQPNKDPYAANYVLRLLNRFLDALAVTPVTPPELLEAPVPALRGNPAGVLRNGTLPNPAPGGTVELVTAGGGAPAHGDLTGDGVDDAAAVITATSGVGGGDQYVAAYTNGAHLQRLGGFDPASTSRSQHAQVLALIIGNGEILIDWEGQGPAAITFWSAHLRWDGHNLVATQIAPHTGATHSDLWTDPELIITPTSLGRVQIGMTITQAEAAAGFTLNNVGDGYLDSSAILADDAHLYIGGTANGTVRCIGAGDDRSTQQIVRTPQGLRLGDSVARLLAVYGVQAQFIPAPTQGGMTNFAGYVVQQPGGSLAFRIDSSGNKIIGISGGLPGLTPNSCTG